MSENDTSIDTFKRWTEPVLQQCLRIRSLRTSGKKEELVALVYSADLLKIKPVPANTRRREKTESRSVLYIYTMEKCIVCLKDDHPTTLIKLRQKGCLGIIKASQERGDCLSALEGNFVHQLCRKTYTNPNDIKKYKKEKLVLREIHTNTPKLRSKSHFDFKHHCLFCGNEATDSKKKDKNVFQVRTDDFESRIQDACDLRNDDWAAEVRGRLERA
ncbi:Hypothetical predicted protein [Mytilus galloprovincialis]|uniref:SAP domain-containing protein n=1 Tax=Mytilus galloprovincialis TaxID=29158 RepID=A0A8B6HF52_MYTGA|nr:Hypothetical predicted protein [Mytilus galloprovincialis]